VALSPTETATEMYRNSIANVRKSGKQAVAGPQTTTQASKTDKGEVNAAPRKGERWGNKQPDHGKFQLNRRARLVNPRATDILFAQLLVIAQKMCS
ncbi:MAG: hypothetical protein AAF700_10390, partial [Pseudomonadota bacterium]